MNSKNILEFRTANLSDITSIAALVNSAYRGDSSKKGWTTEADLLGGQRTDPTSLQEMITAEGNVILVFFKDNILVGSVFLQKKHGSSYLGMLTVTPELQTVGLGKQIIAAAEEFVSNSWNIATIEMTVINKRIELIAWYEKRGYALTGDKEPFPYNDERFGIPKVKDLEFVVMRKYLGCYIASDIQ